MALKQGTTYFCKWIHFENGRITHRRLHVLEIQDRAGQIHAVKGEQLPHAFVTSCGDKVQGHHVGQILLRPGDKPSRSVMDWKETPPPPTFRDIVAMSVGVFLYQGLYTFLDAIARLF